MAFTGAMVGGEDFQNGSGGPASAFGSSKPYFGKSASGTAPSAGSGIIKSIKNPFRQDSAGKLSKSGASTRSESLARLRGKGAIA